MKRSSSGVERFVSTFSNFRIMLMWRQILENHSSQILHLAAELEQLRKEFAEREKGQQSGI